MKLLRGEGKQVLTKSEEEAQHHVSFRRSIYVSRDMKAGEKISLEDLDFLRPMHGMCASKFEDVIGKTILRDICIGYLRPRKTGYLEQNTSLLITTSERTRRKKKTWSLHFGG